MWQLQDSVNYVYKAKLNIQSKEQEFEMDAATIRLNLQDGSLHTLIVGQTCTHMHTHTQRHTDTQEIHTHTHTQAKLLSKA